MALNPPNILICSPTSIRHKHLIDKWLSHLETLNYKNFRVCLVDTTPDSDEFYNYIRNKKVNKIEIICWRRPWDNKKEYALQMLANVREEIRQFFIQHKEFNYLLWLDTDIFLPKNGVEKLISANKDLVGFYVHVYYKPGRKPCIFKTGEIVIGKGLEYFTFSEINAYKKFVERFEKNKLTKQEKLLVPFIVRDKWRPKLFQPYAVNLGCILCSRKVAETIPFRTHPTFLMGEDLWWFTECNDKGFQFWCDSSVRPKHENITWKKINEKDLRFRKKCGIYLAYGPEKSEGVVFMDYHGEFKKNEKDMSKTNIERGGIEIKA